MKLSKKLELKYLIIASGGVSMKQQTSKVALFAHVIIGTLEIEFSGSIFLLHSEQLDNFSKVSKVFDKSKVKLWPDRIRHYHVLLFLLDAVPYLKKAGK